MNLLRTRRLLVTLVVLGTLVGCGAPTTGTQIPDNPGAQGGRQMPTKRGVTIVETREPTSLEPSLQPQNREWSALGSGFLASFQSSGPVPYLAEELPSIGKGSSTVLPDGRMETTYKI